MGCAGGFFTEELVIISGLLVVQVIYGSYSVLLSGLLSTGLHPLFLVFAANLATFFLLAPFAVALERKKWPEKLTGTLVVHFFLLSFGGVTVFQALTLMGLNKTSPTIASAMQNLSPGLIFIIAASLRFEKVDMRCTYSRAKILGTLTCLGGVLAMTFLQNTPSPSSPTTLTSNGSFFFIKHSQNSNDQNEDWIIGCSCLFSAVFIVSCSMVLQAATLRELPAPLSLTAITSLLGAILTAPLQLIQEGKINVGPSTISIPMVVAYVLLGGAATGICIAFQSWSIKKRGPVLVSTFSPIATVSSAILSALTLREYLSWESLVGMMIMFAGLYVVLWAKNKEHSADENDAEVEDVEKPLLS